MSENNSSKSWWENPKVVIWVLGIVAGAGLLAVVLPLGLTWGGSLSSKNAQFYVSEVGVPLLTFAGFLAVYLGFLSQREQNDLQREQLEQQQANFQKDRFESTFFQLLRTQNAIVNDIRLEQLRQNVGNPSLRWSRQEQDSELIQMRGRSCFEVFYSEFESLFETKAEEDITSVYEDWYENEKSTLNHYFNNLTKIISFVDESDVEDKQFYIDLVIAQMSVPELKLFFYHSASMTDQKRYVGRLRANSLLSKYTFFEQLRDSSLLHESHSNLHPEAMGV